MEALYRTITNNESSFNHVKAQTNVPVHEHKI